MPILVQWKWKERTKSFLVIFHFFDDYSNHNLRIKKKPELWKRLYPQKEAWMTWAPSHVELGMLGELLRYANIVDGLKESEKRELRDVLEGLSSDSIYDISFEVLPEGKQLVASSEHLVVELCTEYIDYLKRVLKPYLKD